MLLQRVVRLPSFLWSSSIPFSKCVTLFFLKIFYLFIFRERAKEGEREGEKHQLVASHIPPAEAWPTTQAYALTGS